MTDQDKSQEQNQETTNDSDEQTSNHDETASQQVNEEASSEELKAKVAALETQLEEAEEIAQRAQSDYMRYKMDMDAYKERAEAGKKKAELDALVGIAEKLLPVVNQLEQTVNNMPDKLADNTRAQGVELTYQKALKELESVGITPIVTEIGDEPDLHVHIPVSTEPTDDKDLQGKIINILETGYTYQQDDEIKVILPSKVVVGTAP